MKVREINKDVKSSFHFSASVERCKTFVLSLNNCFENGKRIYMYILF